MYKITIKLHGELEVVAYRDTKEAAERYANLQRKNGVSLLNRWYNPSNIEEVIIDEPIDTTSQLEADPGVAPAATRGRKRKTPVRSGDK